MSVTVEERLRMAACFNEPLPAEDVAGVTELVTDLKRRLLDELEQEKRSFNDDREAFTDREEELRDKLKQCKAFLTKVHDWLSNSVNKRAGITAEVASFLQEQMRGVR